MAKALKEWTFISQTTQKQFARYCTNIIDKDSAVVTKTEPMQLETEECIVADVYDIDTKAKDSQKTIVVTKVYVVKLDHDGAIYCAEDSDHEQYYFDVWRASYPMTQAIIETWLKSVNPNAALAYLGF